MKSKNERYLYLKKLYDNSEQIIRGMLYDKYMPYINYHNVDKICDNCTDYTCIYDPVDAFFDTVCKKLIDRFDKTEKAIIYLTLSPYHKKDVVCSLTIISDNNISVKISNTATCKSLQLYTKPFSSKDTYFAELAYDLFRLSNKIQQK